MRHIDEIIVHCTATRADWWKSKSAAQKVREVRRWHVDVNGWDDVGYHFLIDRNGTIVEGRAVEKAGAHTKGRNEHSIGICLFGGHGGSENDQFSDHFTPEQETALRDLIDRLQLQFGETYSPHGGLKVTGHNQYAAKACPCFNAPNWYMVKPARKPSQSTTIRAAAGTAVAGAGGVITALSKLDPQAQYIVLGFSALALIGLGWIARERLRRWAAGHK